MYKAVIFDFDGIICTTDKLHQNAWEIMCKENGLFYDVQCAVETRGNGREESLRIILNRNGVLDSVGPQNFASMCVRKNEIFLELVKSIDDEYLNKAVKPFCDWLHKVGIKTGIASSSKNSHISIERLQIAKYFDVIVTGIDISNSKPHPESFLRCLDLLNLDGESCVAIEDAMSGLEAAKRAKMTAVYIGDNSEYFNFSDYSFRTLVECFEIMFKGTK